MTTSNDELDWFDKEEDDLLKDFQEKCPQISGANETSIEHITEPKSTDVYLRERQLFASSSTANATKKLHTPKLRIISEMCPLDAFLHVSSIDENFWVDQIFPNDGQDRVYLYLCIINSIGSLELPIFHEEILMQIASNDALLEHLRYFTTKFFSKQLKLEQNWEKFQHIFESIKIFFSSLKKLKAFTPKCLEVMEHIRKVLSDNQTDIGTEHKSTLEFQRQLAYILDNKVQSNMYSKDETEIYPTLNELLTPYNKTIEQQQIDSDVACPNELFTLDKETTEEQKIDEDGSAKIEANSIKAIEDENYNSVVDYLSTQIHLLRKDFIVPLQELVCAIRNKDNNALHTIYKEVKIVLNDQFLTSQRHEMLFVKISDTDLHNFLQFKDMKIGTLLCLTTSLAFDNLILATTTYTDGSISNKGYLGVEIVRQFNIGNIYEKNFFMFETPAFFGAYSHVYNYLKNCSIQDFPMKQYIVDCQANVAPPSYLTENTIFKYDKESFSPLNETLRKTDLNPSQRAAFSHALANEFSLIQGPPGTGKTHLSIQLMKTLIENVKTPIVLITYTNESLDKFLLNFTHYTTNIVRFGSQSKNSAITKYTIPNIVDKKIFNPRLKCLHFVAKEELKKKFAKLQNLHDNFDGTDESYKKILAAQREVCKQTEKLEVIRIMFQYYTVQKSAIIAMTTSYAAKINFLFRLLKSPIVIFEEAAEILESHVIACLTPYTKHVIMIGDHFQLKPYTTVHQHKCNSQLPMMISLFERLINQQMKAAVLTTQYRMRPCIADLLQPTIYKELKNADIVESYPLVRGMLKNLYFHTHTNEEIKTEYETSFVNNYEAENIIFLAQHLISYGKYETDDIVLLTPYINQVSAIRKMLSKNRLLSGIKVATVDSFQGLEAKIVLLSLVRSNNSRQIGFLAQNNRICVALSRAKHGLYIIGNMDLLASCSKTWNAIKQKLVIQDAIGDAFPYELIYDKSGKHKK